MFKKLKDRLYNFESLTKNRYGKSWNEKSGKEQVEWYDKMHNSCTPMHDNFISFLEKNFFKTVLEIGCGTGYYPIKLSNLFEGKEYTGLDFSETAIENCKLNSKFDFIANDFLKYEFNREFDLIFSHAVIDHVYDIEKFIEKITKLSTKYAYITSYRGFFSELKDHQRQWNGSEGSYYNNISISSVKNQLKSLGFKESEFDIKSIKVDNKNRRDDFQTIIKIIKEN